MQITQPYSWPAVNWPDGSTPATQYTIFRVYPDVTPTIIATATTTTAQIVYDDTTASVYQIRPSAGTDPNATYGPEAATFVIGTVSCRAWLRQRVRQALADRLDAGTTVTWPDDEINGYIEDAITELNVLFPVERGDLTIPLLQNERDYQLPSDFFQINTVCFNTMDGHLQLFLKEMPFRGGESTATSYIGYPKLGILLPPRGGRFYTGHFDIYDGALHLDWDPTDVGDTLIVRYYGRRAIPVSDATLLDDFSSDDLTLILLRTQMSCCYRIEAQDSRLSRWIDTKKRDDMPTIRHSAAIKQLYDQIVNDRREQRPRVHRLVRR
jgi:hypothetical protein